LQQSLSAAIVILSTCVNISLSHYTIQYKTLPIQQNASNQHTKGEMERRIPTHCACGETNYVDRSLRCKLGGCTL